MWFRFPSEFALAAPYALSDAESLLPGGEEIISRPMLLAGEKNDFASESVVYDGGPLGSLGRLRGFIEFWCFVLNDCQPASAFLNDGQIRRDTAPAPAPVPTPAQKYAHALDPLAVKLEAGVGEAEMALPLSDLYLRFVNADTGLHTLVNTLMHTARTSSRDPRRTLFDSPWEAAMGSLRVMDALDPSPLHKHRLRGYCGTCQREVDAEHVDVTHRDRLKGLFKKFPQGEHLADLAHTAFKTIRHPLAHGGWVEMPATSFPELDPQTGIGVASSAIADGAKNLLGSELEAEHAIDTLQTCARVLLLNRLYPEIDFWPVLPDRQSIAMSFSAMAGTNSLLSKE